MMQRQGLQRVITRAAMYTVLIAYSVVVVFPLLWVFYTAFKTNPELYQSPWALPARFSLDNFIRAWHVGSLYMYFGNSIIVTFVSVLGLTIIGAMAAYVLARYRFRGSTLILFTFLGGMMVPLQLVITPLFILARDLGLLNTRIGVILPYIAFSLPFTVFLLTGFFKTLPSELEEAAIIDGCSEFSAFFKIMLPLAKPGLVTAAIFNALSIWNEYLLALVLLQDSKVKTLPLGLTQFLGGTVWGSEWTVTFAGLVIVLLPILLFYIAVQEKLVGGITTGALKG